MSDFSGSDGDTTDYASTREFWEKEFDERWYAKGGE